MVGATDFLGQHCLLHLYHVWKWLPCLLERRVLPFLWISRQVLLPTLPGKPSPWPCHPHVRNFLSLSKSFLAFIIIIMDEHWTICMKQWFSLWHCNWLLFVLSPLFVESFRDKASLRGCKLLLIINSTFVWNRNANHACMHGEEIEIKQCLIFHSLLGLLH